MDYGVKAVITLGIAFFPYLGLYIAIPTASIMGMDIVSALLWSIFGYFAAVPFVDLCIEKLMKVRRFRALVERSQKSRISSYYRSHADWTLAFLGPVIGIWVAPLIGRLAGLKRRKIYLLLFIGAVLCALAIAGIMVAGLRAATEVLPGWLLDRLAEQG